MSSTQEELQAGEGSTPFKMMWLETTMGVRYEMPDMLPVHIDEAHRQLDEDQEHISLLNVSDACLVVPKRIIAKAGVGDRCFWERA